MFLACHGDERVDTAVRRLLKHCAASEATRFIDADGPFV